MPDDPKQGVLVIVTDSDGDWLVGRRSRRARRLPLALTLPGGWLQLGEPPEQAAARELAEEAGFLPATLTYLVRLHAEDGLTTHVFTASLASDLDAVQLRHDEGIEAWAWMSPDMLRAVALHKAVTPEVLRLLDWMVGAGVLPR